MRQTGRRMGCLCLGLLLALPAVVGASPRSELLVAKGEVAYHKGQYAEAHALFEEAVAADPGDAEAHHALGLALSKLGRWHEAVASFERALALRPDLEQARQGAALARSQAGIEAPTPQVEYGAPAAEREMTRPPEPGQRWALRASTGLMYDSNVTLAPGGQEQLGVPGQSDGAVVVAASGQYDAVSRPDVLFRLEYDIYQSLYFEVTDFNLRWQRIRGTASYALLPWLWAGAQGGYNRFALGGDGYLSEPFVFGFLSFLQKEWGLAQILYRHGDDTYLAEPFKGVRDGPIDAFGLNQTLYLGDRYLTLGYQYEQQDPISSAGDDFQFGSNQGYVQFGTPAWWRTDLEFVYLYRFDDYTEPNSRADFTKTRQDSGSYLYASVSRPITKHIRVVLAYAGTFNQSNIDVFTYDRNVVTGLIEVAY